MRRLVAVAAAFAALTACGAGPGIEPAAYASQVCGAISAYEKTLTTQSTAYAAAEKAAGQDPRRLQTATTTFLTQQVAGSETLLRALQRVDRPKGAGGQQVQDTFVRTAAKINGSLRTQQQAVSGADPGNRVAFFQVLDSAHEQFAQAGQDLATALETVAGTGSQQLNDAFAADETCSSL